MANPGHKGIFEPARTRCRERISIRLNRLAILAALLPVLSLPAQAATDSGCWVVVNVAAGDALNMRARASYRSAIVDRLIPGRHGIIGALGRCRPANKPWRQRWCPVSHSSGDYPTTRGWVKARFVRGSGCP